MTGFTLLDLALAGLISGAAGTGFAVLMQASPFGRIPRKPFSCRTCLSGWGSIGVSWFLIPPIGVGGTITAGSLPDFLFAWFVLSLVGAGIAHVLLSTGAASAASAAPAAALLPDFFDPANSPDPTPKR